MRPFISIILGFPIFVLFVFNPMRANLLTSTAVTVEMSNESRLILLFFAQNIDPCNIKILNKIGDITVSEKQFYRSLWAYNQIALCSPGNALARIRYGETLLSMGHNGLFGIQQAYMLEPHNPYFKLEVDRVTTLQSLWP